MDYLAQATARIAIKSLQRRCAAVDADMRASLAFVVVTICICAPLLAQLRGVYEPYRSVFEVRQHVDGSPLLIDGRFEYYLFPDAKRERTPDRSISCSTRILVQSLNLIAGFIRSAARARR